MSTSIHSGIVAFDASLYGTDDDPADTTIVRDGIANGLLHAADSMGQVRVNVCYPDGSSFASDAWEYGDIASSPVANQWYRIGGGPFGEWPLTIHNDGTPYKLRIRVGVAASSGGASTQTLRVVIAPNNFAVSERDQEADNVFQVVFLSVTIGTTPTWAYDGTSGISESRSQGTANSLTTLTVPARRAAAWTRSTTMYDAVSSGSPSEIQQCLVGAHVFGKTSVSGIVTRLHALHISEYVGT